MKKLEIRRIRGKMKRRRRSRRRKKRKHKKKRLVKTKPGKINSRPPNSPNQ